MTTSTVYVPEGFVLACARDEIPARGKKTVHIDDMTVLIVACETGLFAVEDRCPQTGRSIARGEVLDYAITAPTTGARYCLRTGRYLGGGQAPLQSHWLAVVALREIGDQVYVRV
jgi:nitrite reductase/ring-hydroxylating ferredoxin subunit